MASISQDLPIHSEGIYHNLPSYPPSVKNLTAIVTGANGISGFHTLRVLLSHPERWSKVYALSRRPPPPEMMALLTESQRSRVDHVPADFLSSPEDIASAMESANVAADAVFFYSYLQPKPKPGAGAWSNAQELVEVNSTLLRNFLSALPLADVKPARILLQTGAKQYGVHLGTVVTPSLESDPRVDLEPNFYYPQEDMLFAHCKKYSADWTVIRPAWIIGAVQNAQMNALHPLAVYAAVQAHRGKKLEYPGSLDAWLNIQIFSTAMLTGYLSEWAVLEEKGKGQAFNATDTADFSWVRFWPELARWYGVEAGIGLPETDEAKLTTVQMSKEKTPLG